MSDWNDWNSEWEEPAASPAVRPSAPSSRSASRVEEVASPSAEEPSWGDDWNTNWDSPNTARAPTKAKPSGSSKSAPRLTKKSPGVRSKLAGGTPQSSTDVTQSKSSDIIAPSTSDAEWIHVNRTNPPAALLPDIFTAAVNGEHLDSPHSYGFEVPETNSDFEQLTEARHHEQNEIQQTIDTPVVHFKEREEALMEQERAQQAELSRRDEEERIQRQLAFEQQVMRIEMERIAAEEEERVRLETERRAIEKAEREHERVEEERLQEKMRRQAEEERLRREIMLEEQQRQENERERLRQERIRAEQDEHERIRKEERLIAESIREEQRRQAEEDEKRRVEELAQLERETKVAEEAYRAEQRRRQEEEQLRRKYEEEQQRRLEEELRRKSEEEARRKREEEERRRMFEEDQRRLREEEQRRMLEEEERQRLEEERVRAQREEEEDRERAHQRALIKLEEERQRRLLEEEADHREQERQVELARRADRRRLSEEARLDRERLERLTRSQESERQTVPAFSLLQESPERNENLMQALKRDLEEEHESNLQYKESVVRAENLLAQDTGHTTSPVWDAVPSAEQFDNSWDVGIPDFENANMVQQPVFDVDGWGSRFAEDGAGLNAASHAARRQSADPEENSDMAEINAASAEEEALMSETAVHMVDGLMDGVASEPHSSQEPSVPSSRLSDRLSIGSLSAEPALPTDPQSSTFVHREPFTSSPKSRRSQDLSFSLSPLHSEKASDDEITDGNRDYRGDVSGSSAYDGSERNFPKENGTDRRRHLSGDYSDYSETDHHSRNRYSSRTSESEYDGPRHSVSPSENRSSSYRDDIRSEASGETVNSAGTSWTITDPSERILRAFGVVPPQQSSFSMPLYTTMMYPYAQQSMYNPVPAPPTFFPSTGYNIQTAASSGSFHVRKHLYPHSIGTYHVDVVQVNNLDNTKYLETLGVSRGSRVRPEIRKFPHDLSVANPVTDEKLIAFCRFMADNISDFGYLDVNKREEGLLWSLLSLLIRHGSSVRNFAISEILMTSSRDPSLNLSSASLLNGSFNESYPGEKRLITVRKSLAAGLIPRACKAAEDLGRTPLAFMLMSLPSVIKTNNKVALAGFLRYIEHTLSPVDPIYTACMLMCGGNPKLSECVKNWTSHVALVIGCGAFIASAAKTKFLLNLAETLGACGRPVARDVLYLLSRPGSRIHAGKELKLIGTDMDGRNFDGRIDNVIEKVHLTEAFIYVANKLQSGTVHALATGFQISYLHFLLDHQLDLAAAEYMAYTAKNYLNAPDTDNGMALSLFGTVMSNRNLLGPDSNGILSGLRSIADQGIVKMKNQLRLEREEEEQRLHAERLKAEEAARRMNEQIMNETAQRARQQEAAIRAAYEEAQRSQTDRERLNDQNQLPAEAVGLEDLALEKEFDQVVTERERVKSARWEEAERVMLTTDSPIPEMHVIEPSEQTQPPPPVFFSVESSSHTAPELPFFGVGNMGFRRDSAGSDHIPTRTTETQPMEDDEHLSFFKLKKPDGSDEEAGSVRDPKSLQEASSFGLSVPVSVESAQIFVAPDVYGESYTMPDRHHVPLFSNEPATSEWSDQNSTRFLDVEGSRAPETSGLTDGQSMDDQETVIPASDPSQYYHLNFTGDVENASVESDAIVTEGGMQQQPPDWSNTQTTQEYSHSEQATGAYCGYPQTFYSGGVPDAGYQGYWNPYYPSQGEASAASNEAYQPDGVNNLTGYYAGTGQSPDVNSTWTGEQTIHQPSDKTRTDETGHAEQPQSFFVVEQQPSHPVSSAPNYWGGNAGYGAQPQFGNQAWGNPPSSIQQSLQGRGPEVPAESDEEPVSQTPSHPPGVYNFNPYAPVPAPGNFLQQPPPPANIQSVPPPVSAAPSPAEPKKPGMLGRFTGFFRKSQDAGVPPAVPSGGPIGTVSGSIPMFSPDTSFTTPFTGSGGTGTVPAYPAAFNSSSNPSTQHGWSDISLNSSQPATTPMYTNAPSSNAAVPYWNTTYSTAGSPAAQYNGSPNMAAFSTGEQNSHPVHSGLQPYGISDQQKMEAMSYPAQFAQFSADVAPGHQMPPLY